MFYGYQYFKSKYQFVDIVEFNELKLKKKIFQKLF